MILIHSFPRAGNHFLRYCLEFLTGQCTHGCGGLEIGEKQDTPICMRHRTTLLGHVVVSGTPVAQKCHFMNEVEHWGTVYPNYTLIYIIRNPLDNIVSHRGINPTEQELNKDVSNYLSNIQHYESYTGKKLLIKYEDLINYTGREIVDLLKPHINILPNKKKEFISKFKACVNDSMGAPLRTPLSLGKGKDYYFNKLKGGKFAMVTKAVNTLYENKTINTLYGTD